MCRASDINILRDLATRYAKLAANPIQDQRRDLWRRHNSLQHVGVPIYVRAFAWSEMPESRPLCQDPFWHPYETALRQGVFRAQLEDDFIIEPWLAVRAAVVVPDQGVWGLPVQWHGREGGGAGVWDPPIKREEDLARLYGPTHRIDEAATSERLTRVQDAVGDLLPLVVDRAPAYRMWDGDISTQLAYLRGLEQIMWDMHDRPNWLHRLLAHMRDGILRTHEQAEQAGHWTLANHQNQAMPYAQELPDPSSDGAPVRRKQLWTFVASQELTGVGPRLWDEFMLQYQIPLMAPFGLSAYGCCEDLTRKINLLRQIANLRRIAVAPAADVARCAEQIGDAYVLSYRPSPADMVAYGWDEDRVRTILREDLIACQRNGCVVDVTLKDVETVQSDPNRIR
ncbi:MAG: hypothetical protein ACP5G7_05730, partial [Anaerolineae bacterium]